MGSVKQDYTAFNVQDWIAYTQKQHSRSIDMTLDRIKQVWNKLNGQQPPLVITVAGTNGKGSCVSMLSAVLKEAGHKVGCFTSPHLIRYNERVAINGQYATDEEICQAFCDIEAARGGITLTYFEYSTLNALLIFAQNKVDIAVLEVGMGGRLDSTNMVDNDIAMITSIGLDHIQWLGDNVEQIGAEKAGVFRQGKTGVFADIEMPKSIATVAQDKGTFLFQYGVDYQIDIKDDGHFSFVSHNQQLPENWQRIDNLQSPFSGDHQIRNTAGVVAVLAHLAERCNISIAQLKSGLSKAQLNGRCQILQTAPEVIVDVAHNEASVRELACFLDSLPVKPTRAIFGALIDKELHGIINLLRDKIDTWELASIDGERGQDAQTLKQTLVSLGIDKPIYCHESAQLAYRAVLSDADENERILVFGSFYIAGDILACQD